MTDQESKNVSIAKAVFGISLLSILFEILHLHNGFPLLLSDSKEYIMRGISMEENSHWSNTYVYFIAKNIQLFSSLHWIPIFQNIFTASILFVCIQKIFPHKTILYATVISILLLWTSLPWMTNVVMSDFATPIALVIILLVFTFTFRWYQYILLAILFFFTASCHQSHIAIIPGFVVCMILLNVLFEKQKKYFILLVKGLCALGIVLCSFVFEKNILNPKQVTKTFSKSSPDRDVFSGYYFVAVRMWEVGELDNLLASFCKDYPGNYLCDPDNPYKIKVKLNKGKDRNTQDPYYRKFSNHNKEFVLACLTKPRFYYACFKVMAKRSIILLTNPSLPAFRPISGKTLDRNIRKVSPLMLKHHKRSSQISGAYKNYTKEHVNIINVIWWIILLPLSIILILSHYKRNGTVDFMSKRNWKIIIALLFAHLCNVVVCGTFSNAYNVRYGSRTLWLVNLAVIIILIFFFQSNNRRNIEA